VSDPAATKRALTDLILDHGDEVCWDQRKVAQLLELRFPGRPIHCVVAHVAVREGVAADLAQDRSPKVAPMVFDRLVHRLGDQAGLEFALAVWATRAWAEALGRVAPSQVPRASVQPIQRRISSNIVNQPGRRHHTLKGHRKALTGVRFSPSGAHLATSSLDRSVRIWNAKSGVWVDSLLGGHRDWVRGVAWSPDGTSLASVGDDGAIRLWAPETGERKYRLAGHTQAALCVDFSKDGQLVASGGADGRICLWRVEGLELCQILDLDQPVHSLSFGPEELAIGTQDQVRTLDPHTLAERQRLQAKGPAVVSMGPGGRLIIGDDSGVAAWDTRTGDERIRYKGHSGAVRSVVLHPNARCLATGGADKTVRVWALDQSEELWRFEPGRRVTDLDMHPMGHLAMSFGNGQCEVREMQFVATLPPAAPE
jgi:WD40 repeat protein